MAPQTDHVARLSTSLIHFYFVSSPLPPWAGSEACSGRSPHEHPMRPSHLRQHWTRNSEGTPAACWHMIADCA